MRVWQVDLADKDGEVDGIVTAVRAITDHLRDAGTDVRIVGAGGDSSIAELVRAVTARGAAQHEVIHLHSVFRPRQDALALLARTRGVPYLLSPHSALAGPGMSRRARGKQLWLAGAGRRVLTGARAVCCLSEREVADVGVAAPRARTAVVRNPLPLDALAQSTWKWEAADPDRVITLARWDVFQKGLDVLARVAEGAPGVSFSVHGSQDKNDPEQTAALIETAPANFALVAPVVGAAKYDALRAAAMYVAPSRWEGLSMSLLEAMVVGVPIAVSGYVAQTIPVADGLGLVLDDRPEVAVAQLTAALARPEQLTERAEAGRRWAMEQCRPGSVADRLGGLYREALERPEGQPHDSSSRMRRAGTPP